MTKHVAELIKENIGGNSKILMLGVAYKRDIPDTRNSPAKLILDELNRKLRRFVNNQSRLSFFASADVKMGHVNFMPLRQFLEYVMMPRRNWMMYIILC
jgi:UDP-N-acetyl-D-mannosaminuronate dehydrogenase